MLTPFESRRTALIVRSRWVFPTLAALSVGGPLLMLGSRASGGPVLASVGLAITLLAALGVIFSHRWNPWTRDVPARIRAVPEGVWADGRLLLLRAAIEAGFVVPDYQDGFKVQLRRRFRRPVEIRVVDAAEGRDLLRALGLDASQVAATFRLPSRMMSEPKLSVPFGVLMGFFFFFGATGSATGGAGIPLFLVIGALLTLVMTVTPTRLTVGADGVLRSWFGRKRFFGWAKVTRIAAYTEGEFWGRSHRWRGVELNFRDGAAVRFAVTQTRSVDDGQLPLIQERMREARESYLRGDTAAEAAQLERRERPIGAWIQSLRAVGSGANQDHRTAPVPEETLFRILEDPAATPAARAGAAVALGVSLDEEGKARLKSAAEAVAAPRLRIAIEAAARGDDEALKAALAEVEDASLHARAARGHG